MPWVRECPRCLTGTVVEGGLSEEVCTSCAVERAKAIYDQEHPIVATFIDGP